MKKIKINIELVEKGEDYYGININGGQGEKGCRYMELGVPEGDMVKKMIEAIKIAILE